MMNIHVVISGKIETVCFIDERVRKDNLNESHRSPAELAASRRQASRGLDNRRYGHTQSAKREWSLIIIKDEAFCIVPHTDIGVAKSFRMIPLLKNSLQVEIYAEFKCCMIIICILRDLFV